MYKTLFTFIPFSLVAVRFTLLTATAIFLNNQFVRPTLPLTAKGQIPNVKTVGQPCPRLFVTIDFVPILAIFHYISWQVSSGEGQSRMTFFWSCKIGSGLDRFLWELEDWCILICLWLRDSQKPEVTGFLETEKKILSSIEVWLIFTLIWLKLCNFA